MLKLISVVSICVGICSALHLDPASRGADDLRYQYAPDSNGKIHLVDVRQPIWGLKNVMRYNPLRSNVYHLFTRENPRVSQPLMPNNVNLLSRSNYKSIRRTIVLIHGWMNSATSNFNSVLLRALLAAEDVNVIVVDWSSGSNSLQYREVNANAISSGSAVAQFINWLNQNTGSVLAQYHIIGHGVGGHQAGIVGRNLNGQVPYITGLDPALIGWVNNIYRFRPSDALYSEVIHTNYGVFGYLADLAKVDFYPNGGISMPGCDSNGCDHERGFQYLAESIASGGFRGRECMNYYAAVLRMCNGPRQLQMGGLEPKTGASGVYFLETNAQPPFSQG
ncbi:pancreatic triacylglycerol lipase-like [Danaus plexippus]|uniref:pancreatic triacylglycerol lipase-like n=1 Tax=Danaus plexippus TaxID=13037 RepID=UPI002AAF7524|nr:pancreatic triacylglycerol lipase-like [Danaus plexippus]